MICRQAINTKYLGHTNFKGARIIASCEAGKIIMPYKHELNHDENHALAADLLMKKLGWHIKNYVRGGYTEKGMVWVQMPHGLGGK